MGIHAGWCGATKVDLKTYIEEKISILKDDFLIRLSWSEEAHLKRLQTKEEVDDYSRKIILEKL